MSVEDELRRTASDELKTELTETAKEMQLVVAKVNHLQAEIENRQHAAEAFRSKLRSENLSDLRRQETVTNLHNTENRISELNAEASPLRERLDELRTTEEKLRAAMLQP